MLEGHPGDGVVVATVGEYEIYDNTDRVRMGWRWWECRIGGRGGGGW
jgi:hypothetical protein